MHNEHGCGQSKGACFVANVPISKFHFQILDPPLHRSFISCMHRCQLRSRLMEVTSTKHLSQSGCGCNKNGCGQPLSLYCLWKSWHGGGGGGGGRPHQPGGGKSNRFYTLVKYQPYQEHIIGKRGEMRKWTTRNQATPKTHPAPTPHNT